MQLTQKHVKITWDQDDGCITCSSSTRNQSVWVNFFFHKRKGSDHHHHPFFSIHIHTHYEGNKGYNSSSPKLFTNPLFRSLTRSVEQNKKVVSFIHSSSFLQRHLRYKDLWHSTLEWRVLMLSIGCTKPVWSYRTYATLWSWIYRRDMGSWWIVSRSDNWNGGQRTSCLWSRDYDAFDLYQYACWKDWSSIEGTNRCPRVVA